MHWRFSTNLNHLIDNREECESGSDYDENVVGDIVVSTSAHRLSGFVISVSYLNLLASYMFNVIGMYWNVQIGLDASVEMRKSFNNFWLILVSLVHVLGVVGSFDLAYILNIHDVSNIWHVPLLLQVRADAVLISGHSFAIDESSMNGEWGE
ncbi:hypothetical protein L1987_63793 [Smallanthus sonchifolius]|uniref:Uncharacterized protein n=1 Tax=Smallanthus sonchifolius TaxID=185202 RepID=A0ACB9CE55_9ASTR|nr:hypothetical protein L1987_63793 [Smallanthus sonchifolius]